MIAQRQQGLFIPILLISVLFFNTASLFPQKPGDTPKVEISVKLKPHDMGPGSKGRIFVTFDFPRGFHQTRNDDFFFIAGNDTSEKGAFSLGPVSYPEGRKEGDVENYYGKVTLSADITFSSSIPLSGASIKAGWQICSDSGTCLFPEEKSILLPLTDTGQNGVLEKGNSSDNSLENTGNTLLLLLKFILFAFIGGLLLNVMPCVLPVLSLRALNLVNQSKNDNKSIFISSLLYGAGVILSLLVMAVVVIILKTTGQMAGWGFQFQNPLFIAVLMVIIFVFSLSLFDVYIINPPGMTGMAKAASKKGYIGSFLNGIFAVLLATPCTAPFLGAALGFAFSQTPLFILASFTAIGAGFALPFVLLGMWPKAIKSLPKPGPWMDTFKEFMGFLLLGTVLYLFSSLRYEIDSNGQLKVFTYLLTAAFIAWIYGKLTKPGSRIKSQSIALLLAVFSLVISGFFFLNFSDNKPLPETKGIVSSDHEGWESFSPDLLGKYRNEGKAVFIEFSAKWCTVCKINDKAIFNTEKGKKFFDTRNIIRLYGDYTNKDPVIGKWISKFGKAGVPVYVYYPPGSDSYVILPELLSWNILKEKIVPVSPKKLDGNAFFNQP